MHDNTPGRSWGSLALRFDGDEGIRAEWENKGCNSLVSEGWNDGVPGNKNKCSGKKLFFSFLSCSNDMKIISLIH